MKGDFFLLYYICDKKPNIEGNHEVHTLYCPSLPPENRRKNIGQFDNCKEAIRSLYNLNGRKGFNFTGCRLCCRPCTKIQ